MFNSAVGIPQRAFHLKNGVYTSNYSNGTSIARCCSSFSTLRRYRNTLGRNNTLPQTPCVLITSASSYVDDVSDSSDGIHYLYQLYFCACLMERTWRFALPLILANLEGMLTSPYMFVEMSQKHSDTGMQVVTKLWPCYALYLLWRARCSLLV